MEPKSAEFARNFGPELKNALEKMADYSKENEKFHMKY